MYFTSNMTTITEDRSASTRLFAGTWRPLWVLLQHHNCFSSSSVISHTFSVLCMYSKPPLLSYPWRKIAYSNHSPSLFDAPGTKVPALRKRKKWRKVGCRKGLQNQLRSITWWLADPQLDISQSTKATNSSLFITQCACFYPSFHCYNPIFLQDGGKRVRETWLMISLSNNLASSQMTTNINVNRTPCHHYLTT